MEDIKTLFEKQKGYYKLTRVDNFGNYNYINYGSNGDRNKKLLLMDT